MALWKQKHLKLHECLPKVVLQIQSINIFRIPLCNIIQYISHEREHIWNHNHVIISTLVIGFSVRLDLIRVYTVCH